jgi:hypothetical protein
VIEVLHQPVSLRLNIHAVLFKRVVLTLRESGECANAVSKSGSCDKLRGQLQPSL